MNKFIAGVSLFVALLFPVNVFADSTNALDINAFRQIQSVNGSNIHGLVNQTQERSGEGGTRVTLVAFGLQPDKQYLSLYYDNHVCALEPYSVDDVIGNYSGNRGGVAVVHNTVTDNLDEINSVSIRDASNFQLLACADIHP
jgi:hypothetical protein